MKVWELQGGFGLQQLALTTRPEPQPGSGQVIVRVRSVSLNYRDLLVVKGQYDPRLQLPRIPCSDGAGDVAAVGPGVTRVKPGDRVAGAFMQDWICGPVAAAKVRSALGGNLDGMLAEYVLLDERGVVKFPAHLSFAEAAALPCAALTAWHALTCQGGLKPGESVLAQGTGGVSIFALQFAKLCGARVIITSSSDEKLDRAKALGADHTINYRANPEWDKRAHELAGGQGVDRIVEVGGAGTLNKSLRAARLGGVIALIGVLAGAAGPIDTVLILMRSLRIEGIYVGNREMFEQMNQAIEHHRLRPIIDRTFAFQEARAAFEFLASGAHFGKVAIDVAAA
jgi:NADPH:quinone reductase-like Zn-dependent oxidoreductase